MPPTTLESLYEILENDPSTREVDKIIDRIKDIRFQGNKSITDTIIGKKIVTGIMNIAIDRRDTNLFNKIWAQNKKYVEASLDKTIGIGKSGIINRELLYVLIEMETYYTCFNRIASELMMDDENELLRMWLGKCGINNKYGHDMFEKEVEQLVNNRNIGTLSILLSDSKYQQTVRLAINKDRESIKSGLRKEKRYKTAADRAADNRDSELLDYILEKGIPLYYHEKEGGSCVIS